MKSEDEARKLLDEYYQLRSTGQLYAYVARQACIEAMTHSEIIADLVTDRDKYANAEYAAIVMIDDRTREIARMTLRLEDRDKTIAEQQREIERLISALIKYGDHKAGCKEQSTMDACTCGLDEVLKS